MEEEPQGCARVTGAVLGEDEPAASESPERETKAREVRMTAQVGRKAPDFNAPAYHRGTFTNIKLSDSFGKWLLLCFYPGDFTFV